MIQAEYKQKNFTGCIQQEEWNIFLLDVSAYGVSKHLWFIHHFYARDKLFFSQYIEFRHKYHTKKFLF